MGLGKLGYGTFYTAAAAFVYILTNEQQTTLSILDIIVLDSNHELFILAVLSLYSALWVHQAGLLIFGEENGLRSSRSKRVSNRYLIHFTTGTSLEKLPQTSSLTQLFFSAVDSGEFNKFQFARFVPVGLLPIYNLIAFSWLTVVLWSGNGDVVAGALWVLLFVLVFRKLILIDLPKYIPPESAEEMEEPAYVSTRNRVRENIDRSERRPRLKSNSSTGTSLRYQTEGKSENL